MSMESVTDFTDGELVDELQDRGFTVTWGRDAEIAELRKQLAAFRSAAEHVTEDGCTRRSVVAMPEWWAMVHKDRLHDLELAEEQLADVRNQVLEECAAVAEDTAAGRDAEAIADAIRAMKYEK